MTSTPASHPRSSRNRRWPRWPKSSAANSSSDKVRQFLRREPIAGTWLLRKVLVGYKKRKLQNSFCCVDCYGALVICSLIAEITGEDLLWSKHFLTGAAVDGQQLRPLRFMPVKGVDVLSRFYVHVAKWIKVGTVMYCSLQSSKAPQIKATVKRNNMLFFFFWFVGEHTYAWFNTMYTFKANVTRKLKVSAIGHNDNMMTQTNSGGVMHLIVAPYSVCFISHFDQLRS